MTTTESELERRVREEQEAFERGETTTAAGETPDGATAGPDPDKGQLFEVPRIKIVVDDSDPTVLKVAFAGSVEIERSDRAWVEFYNRLKPGKPAELTVSVHVAGAKNTHRRDSEGDVDAVVQTKSLIVTDLHLDGE